ncbi:MAG: YdeI/OmpD-associated family protein [Cyclobacteriaceae bacterium]
MTIHKFNAEIALIGINPFVFVPEDILQLLFEQANKTKGPIPIEGTVNKQPYQQTLVKFQGAWRLYINTSMLKNSPQRIGETVTITIQFDSSNRTIAPHPKWVDALNRNKKAKAIYDQLTPSLKKEIVRYISFLKTEASVDKNVVKAINFLLGKGSFIGREKP